jgi:hypothetical protein
MKSKLILLVSLLISLSLFSQEEEKNNSSRISSYIGIAIPITSFTNEKFTSNFTTSTSLVFPFGFNIKKSKLISYSIEFDPVITFSNNGSSLTNFAVLPGILFHREIVTYGVRAAFETKGRYGLSFSALKSIIQKEKFNLVIGIPLDFRVGNQSSTSLGTGIIAVLVL